MKLARRPTGGGSGLVNLSFVWNSTRLPQKWTNRTSLGFLSLSGVGEQDVCGRRQRAREDAQRGQNLPVQVVPSPSYPGKQEQKKPPIVFVHRAKISHGRYLHSFSSENVEDRVSCVTGTMLNRWATRAGLTGDGSATVAPAAGFPCSRSRSLNICVTIAAAEGLRHDRRGRKWPVRPSRDPRQRHGGCICCPPARWQGHRAEASETTLPVTSEAGNSAPGTPEKSKSQYGLIELRHE